MTPHVPPAPSTTPTLLLFGPAPAAEHEFRDVFQWLATRSSESTPFVLERSPVESLRERLAGPAAALAVVLQSWPDEVSAADAAAALGEWPVCRWICCYGPWCESAGRTRDAWPRAVSVPAARAVPRLEREFAVISGNTAPLALTASREEQFAWETLNTEWDADGLKSLPGPIRVEIPDRQLAAAIADRLRSAGADVCDPAAGTHAATDAGLIVWDIDPLLGARRQLDAANLNAALTVLAGVKASTIRSVANPKSTISLSPTIDAADRQTEPVGERAGVRGPLTDPLLTLAPSPAGNDDSESGLDCGGEEISRAAGGRSQNLPSANYPGQRVVALTGFADGELIATLNRLGVSAVVSKLAGLPTLIQAIHTVATPAAATPCPTAAADC